MLRPIAFALVCALVALHTQAEEVPGTSVSLTPPDGFVAANRFPGFMKESTGSSIMISEIPGPYAEVTAGFSDQVGMRAQGMELLSKSSAKVDGHEAMLLQVEQIAYDILFRKWLVVVDRSGSTVLIVATYPESESKQEEKPLRAAILAATFGKPTDPRDALVFSATPVAPFQVAKVMGQSMIFSPNGQFPVKDERVPFMILTLSLEDLAIPDQMAFAESRVTKIATVENLVVDQTTPITIGDLPGYATTARGEKVATATPLTIYQVVLFDASGYCLILGITPSEEKSTYLPVFEEIAKTFKMKESHNESVNTDEN